jgi:hypothetical protein
MMQVPFTYDEVRLISMLQFFVTNCIATISACCVTHLNVLFARQQ